MAQEVLCSWTTVVILGETLGDEVLKVLAEVALQARSRVLGDMEEDLHWVDVAQGRLSVGHLHSCDTQRPDISLEAVSVLLDDLRGHPEWCSNESVSLRLDVGQLSGDSKISELDFASLGEENISGLDISMNLAFSV